LIYIAYRENIGDEKMKKVLLIIMCLGVVVTSMVGCNKSIKNSNKDESNGTQIEEPVEDNNVNKTNFIITQNEGEEAKSYVVTWELGKLNFKSLKISDGDVVRIYGVLEGENEKGMPIIKSSLIDLAM